ncbi:TetR family transcriptional regulator [Paenibacillus validus]|uniref:TetR family transcriptional regulator n=1 Tax=Paenibacillus validus TaxID=44253 RepID=A0A7X2Z6N0_9BACL|nr:MULTISPECIES: TetR family transcriptional regulator [Paenibacillus]MED4600235.1 TetR family transcriptional regulator [Paenibacillus validus]MED4605236.1 TetR family transcriptional regulator [Paenibacillus validus]MUG69289.1 TetR family transcriptional regulator [Paenibacillus validus]
MAPKSKFKKDQIIDAAFEIARTEGIDRITIRKVAEKLGSSIAPIYVNFKEVDELIQEVIKKTFAISKQLLMEQNTGHPFHDIGVASLRFAKEYSVLFRDLVMKKNEYMNDHDHEMGMLVELMKQDPHLEGLTDGELMTILLKMKIFQTGLSVMVANGLLPDDFDEEKMIHLLNSTAMDIIDAAQMRKAGNLEGQN